MRRLYKSGAVAAAPGVASATSEGYPSEGDLPNGVAATVLGAYWVHMVTEAIVTVIVEAGLNPSDDPNQFRDAVLELIPTGTDFATPVETVAGVIDNKATTPLSVKAALDALIDSAPGALDTLNKLAAALGDDPNRAATVNATLALRAPLESPVFTGNPRAPTPAEDDDDTSVATTAFVKTQIAADVADFFGGAPYREYAAAGQHNYQWEWGHRSRAGDRCGRRGRRRGRRRRRWRRPHRFGARRGRRGRQRRRWA